MGCSSSRDAAVVSPSKNDALTQTQKSLMAEHLETMKVGSIQKGTSSERTTESMVHSAIMQNEALRENMRLLVYRELFKQQIELMQHSLSLAEDGSREKFEFEKKRTIKHSTTNGALLRGFTDRRRTEQLVTNDRLGPLGGREDRLGTRY